MRGFRERLKELFHSIQMVNRYKATEMLELETKELEHMFGLFLFGSFVGMPAPPAPIALELLPYMERELELMFVRSAVAGNALSELSATLGDI